MSPCKGPQFALPASKIHALSFDEGWGEKEFECLLKLPTSRLWMTENALLLCSQVADEMEILTIGVIPNARRQHLAQNLLYEMNAYATENGVKKIFLEVAEDNLPAQNLYLKDGFIQTSTRKDYYKRPDKRVNALCFTIPVLQPCCTF